MTAMLMMVALLCGCGTAKFYGTFLEARPSICEIRSPVLTTGSPRPLCG
jgi:hypothetical protein